MNEKAENKYTKISLPHGHCNRPCEGDCRPFVVVGDDSPLVRTNIPELGRDPALLPCPSTLGGGRWDAAQSASESGGLAGFTFVGGVDDDLTGSG